ncbi:MAG TPA: SDR family oxidoreductase [Burkholderiales bacterium]|nr:SDR family oxidoreductase [Burkholderiales bacterium]
MSKVALVTGAGTGIGRAAAHAMLKDGYRVALVGRRKELLEETAQGHEKATLVLAGDITQPAVVKEFFAKVKSTWGRLDVLFNNAGMGAPAVPMEELPYEKWLEVVNINLNAMFLCCQEAVRLMKAQQPKGGRIINNGSISAHAPRPNTIAYTATKHAVTGLTKSISLDGRPHDIACGQIDIGNAATEMTERMTKGVQQANGTIMVEDRMDVTHVGQAVLQMANFPLQTNVQFMTIMATKMPFVGRG